MERRCDHEHVPCDLPRAMTSSTLRRTSKASLQNDCQNEAKDGEVMFLYWDGEGQYWIASCGPPLGPRQLCFRTSHINIFHGGWIRWDCNKFAKPSNEDIHAVDWNGGTVTCQTCGG